jgi:hypothetical protein
VQRKICISKKTGIPLDILDGSNGHGTKLTARALVRHNTGDERNHCNDDGTETVVSALSILSVRPKDETPEERSERKRALRQYRKVCDVTWFILACIESQSKKKLDTFYSFRVSVHIPLHTVPLRMALFDPQNLNGHFEVLLMLLQFELRNC